jgi:hypothetical protein
MHHRTVRNPLLSGAAALVLVALPATLAAPASAQVDHQVGVAPVADPALAVLPGGRAFEFVGLGDDFVFLSGAQYVELPNGEARLVGLLARRADPDQRFLVDLAFQARAPRRGAGYPPAGRPILELAPHAYSPNGGTIDPV